MALVECCSFSWGFESKITTLKEIDEQNWKMVTVVAWFIGDVFSVKLLSDTLSAIKIIFLSICILFQQFQLLVFQFFCVNCDNNFLSKVGNNWTEWLYCKNFDSECPKLLIEGCISKFFSSSIVNFFFQNNCVLVNQLCIFCWWHSSHPLQIIFPKHSSPASTWVSTSSEKETFRAFDVTFFLVVFSSDVSKWCVWSLKNIILKN